MMKRLPLICIFSTTFVCCIFGRVVLANTEILEVVHPLAYSSSSAISNCSVTEDITRIAAAEAVNGQACIDRSLEKNGELQDADSWFTWLWGSCGAFLIAFLKWYTVSLESSPVLTKSITSGFMGALGDIFAQAMEVWTNGGTWERKQLDIRRMFSIAAEGLLVSGPLMHYSYEMLEEHLPIFAEDNDGNDLHSWYMTICQVVIDMLVMDSVFVATMMITSALLEGRGKEIRRDMAISYIPAVKVSWFNSFCWAPVQCLSFKYIPYNYRVLAINMQDIAWNASVSYMAHRSRHADDDEDATDHSVPKVQEAS